MYHNKKLYKAIKETPRECFVLKKDIKYANLDEPLSIGFGQTISQPSLVYLMTDLLDIEKTDRVLEIGTGCGFQAAILSKLAKEVFSLEIIEELSLMAKENLKKLNISNVHLYVKDGNEGLLEKAPFDKIILTACAQKIPPKLLEQLKNGGLMVGPIKKNEFEEILVKITKNSPENIIIKEILPVKFVPFV